MTPEEIAALNRAIARLFERWRVASTVGARILGIEPELYACWKKGDTIEMADDLELRLALLLGIHMQLRTLFKERSRGYAWMKKHNMLFGRSPLSMIASGDIADLARLNAYLAAETQSIL